MRRIRFTFWALVGAAVLATGALSRSLAMHPGPAAGIAVAVSGVILAVSALLAVRILIVLGRPDHGIERSTRERHHG